MAKTKYERPLPGNPQQLTIAQHIHSKWSISQFADGEGRVSVLRKGQDLPFETSPSNNVFCAMRAWDQGTERKLFLQVERAFHQTVEETLATGTVSNHRAVTEYVSVWEIRAKLAAAPPEDFVLNGLSGSGLTREQEEILERKGVMFVRDGGAMPGRFGVSVQALRDHDYAMAQLGNISWGVLRSGGTSRFLCPDRPGATLYIPISPTTALVAGEADQVLSGVEVDHLNRCSLERARLLVFGHPSDVKTFSER